MLQALFNSVLPVFAIVGIGVLLARTGVMEVSAAQVINKYLFLVGLPALGFGFLARTDLGSYDWPLLGAYFTLELFIYALAFVIFRYGLKRGAAESVVLAMGTFFANHLLYVLPIAIAEYGQEIGLEIITFVTIDAVIFYVGSIIWLEFLTAREGGVNFAGIGLNLLKNPQIIVTFLALGAAAIGLPMDNGLGTFTDFVGRSAAPLSLFALGLIMSQQRIAGRQAVPWALVGTNLVVLPALGYLIYVFGFGMEVERVAPAILVAAGPVGLMPFVLALQYGQPTGEIARAVLYSTILSVITVAIALQLV